MGDAWHGYFTTDPSEMESRFSVTDSLAYMDSIFDEPSEESLEKISRIREILPSLPAREADFVELYYFKHLKQTAIAKIFRVSQPTVCYRLRRAADRIKFLLQLPDVSRSEIEAAVAAVIHDKDDAQIMVLMYDTTCQSEVAKRMGMSQGKVRHRFMRSLERMRRVSGLEVFVSLFDAIAGNLNILREVSRAAAGDAVLCVVD